METPLRWLLARFFLQTVVFLSQSIPVKRHIRLDTAPDPLIYLLLLFLGPRINVCFLMILLENLRVRDLSQFLWWAGDSIDWTPLRTHLIDTGSTITYRVGQIPIRNLPNTVMVLL